MLYFLDKFDTVTEKSGLLKKTEFLEKLDEHLETGLKLEQLVYQFGKAFGGFIVTTFTTGLILLVACSFCAFPIFFQRGGVEIIHVMSR